MLAENRLLAQRSHWSTLALACLMLVSGCIAVPGPDATRGTESDRRDVAQDLAILEDEVISRVNAYRRSQGLPLLVEDDFIAAIAREHSVQMAAGRRPLGHDGFNRRADAINEQTGAQSVSENVSYNNYPASAAAERVVTGWIRSPGHHQNMIGDYDRMGTGAARSRDGAWYVTQIYIRTK